MSCEHEMPWIDGYSFYCDDMFCMFCGQKVQNQQGLDYGEFFHPCNHVLFLATDDGFDYCSPMLLRILGWDETDVEVTVQTPPQIGMDIRREV